MPLLRAKKLYFDVSIINPDTSDPGNSNEQVFTVTDTGTGTSERYGSFLQDLPALQAGSSDQNKQKNAVTAEFQCAGEQFTFCGPAPVIVSTSPMNGEIFGPPYPLNVLFDFGEPVDLVSALFSNKDLMSCAPGVPFAPGFTPFALLNGVVITFGAALVIGEYYATVTVRKAGNPSTCPTTTVSLCFECVGS